MPGLLKLAHAIDQMNEYVGRAVAWLALAMVLLQFVIVLMRYVFGLASLYMQESMVYMHAIVFMVAAGYTLVHDGHVRVDIFYGSASPRRKALINLLGVAFLLWPMAVFTWVIAWSYVATAWRIREGSPEGSGLPYVYLLKTLILVFSVSLFLQGLSLLIRSVQALKEDREELLPHAEEGPQL